MEVDNQAGTNVFADRVDRRLPVPVERPVAELRLTGAGEDPVQAQLVLPLLAPQGPPRVSVYRSHPDPHSAWKMVTDEHAQN